jgi:osmoprotectant transport system substrate-binding protein
MTSRGRSWRRRGRRPQGWIVPGAPGSNEPALAQHPTTPRARRSSRVSPVAIVGATAVFGGVLGVIVVSRYANGTEVVAVTVAPTTVARTVAPTTTVATTTTRAVTTTTTTTSTAPAPTTTLYTGPGAPLRFTPLDFAGDQIFAGLADGSIQVGFVYSSQARVALADLVVLEDDRALQVAQHVIPVARNAVLNEVARATLDGVSAALTTADLRTLNLRLEQGVPMEQLVREWLHDHELDSGFPPLSGTVRVGSVDFAESELVSRLYAGALSVRGMNVTFAPKLGKRAVVMPMLESGTLDLTAEYSSAYLALLGGTATTDLAATMADLQARAVARGLWVGGASPAQDTDAIAVTRATAEKYQLVKVSDLGRLPDSLAIGGPPDCLARPTCVPGLIATYGLTIV